MTSADVSLAPGQPASHPAGDADPPPRLTVAFDPTGDLTRCAAIAAGTGLLYAALATAMWQVQPSWGSAFWPAAGVTFAALVRSPRRCWPLILSVVGVAELGVSLVNGVAPVTAGWGAAANVVEPLIGAAIFVHLVPARRLVDLHGLVVLVLGGAVAGPATAAVLGGVVAAGGADPFEDWLRWFVGDAVGVVAVAPVLLTVAPRALPVGRREAVGLVVTTTLVASLLLAAPGTLAEVIPYLAVPVLLWWALRVGMTGAAVATAVVAATTHVSTATGHGSFSTHGDHSIVIAQVFIGVVALSALTVACLSEEVERRRSSERDLLHQALHDRLTGLANRTMLEVVVTDEEVAGVLVVDLDRFKAINDSLGHLAGDEVLRQVARRLEGACRATDVVARLGGDEFIVVARGHASPEDLLATSRRIRDVVARPIEVAGTTIRIGASVGAVPMAEGLGLEALLLDADLRMLAQKRERRAGHPDGALAPAIPEPVDRAQRGA